MFEFFVIPISEYPEGRNPLMTILAICKMKDQHLNMCMVVAGRKGNGEEIFVVQRRFSGFGEFSCHLWFGGIVDTMGLCREKAELESHSPPSPLEEKGKR